MMVELSSVSEIRTAPFRFCSMKAYLRLMMRFWRHSTNPSSISRNLSFKTDSLVITEKAALSNKTVGLKISGSFDLNPFFIGSNTMLLREHEWSASSKNIKFSIGAIIWVINCWERLPLESRSSTRDLNIVSRSSDENFL